MGQQFWPFGTFDWDEQWYWDISKKRYSMIIRDTYMTWPWLSQMDFHFSMREVETCCNNTYINSRRREGNNHSHALASRLCKTLRMFHIQYPLWISLNQWSHPKASPVSGLNYVHSTRINFCQPFFCSKEPGIYIYTNKLLKASGQMCFKSEIVAEIARLHENSAYSILGVSPEASDSESWLIGGFWCLHWAWIEEKGLCVWMRV